MYVPLNLYNLILTKKTIYSKTFSLFSHNKEFLIMKGLQFLLSIQKPTLNCFISFERTFNDEELTDASVEEDGLVVVVPCSSKLIVRRQLKTNHQALHLGVNLPCQVRSYNIKCDEGV